MTTYTDSEVRHLIRCACMYAFGEGKRWEPDSPSPLNYDTIGPFVIGKMEHNKMIEPAKESE